MNYLPSKKHGQFDAEPVHERRHDRECPCMSYVKTPGLPDYPVVVIHLIDPPGSGLAACCGLPWKKNPNESIGQTLWFCTGCSNAMYKGDKNAGKT